MTRNEPMPLLAWSFRQLVVIWFIAGVCSVLLFLLGGLLKPRPESFFCTVPARNVPHAIWLVTLAFP